MEQHFLRWALSYESIPRRKAPQCFFCLFHFYKARCFYWEKEPWKKKHRPTTTCSYCSQQSFCVYFSTILQVKHTSKVQLAEDFSILIMLKRVFRSPVQTLLRQQIHNDILSVWNIEILYDTNQLSR